MGINSQNQFWNLGKFWPRLLFLAFIYTPLEMRVTQTLISCMYILTYPFYIFDADVTSFLGNKFHSVVTAFSNCNAQGNPLFGK